MKLLKRLTGYIRGEDLENPEEEPDKEIELEAQKPQKKETPSNLMSFSAKRGSKNPKMSDVDTEGGLNVSSTQVAVMTPCDVDDAASACDYLKQGRICVINLEGVERLIAQRIADFLGGAAYAIDGDIQRISADIFIVAPAGVNITGEFKGKVGDLILPWVSSSFN